MDEEEETEAVEDAAIVAVVDAVAAEVRTTLVQQTHRREVYAPLLELTCSTTDTRPLQIR